MKRLELLRLAKHYHLKVACLPFPPHPRKYLGVSKEILTLVFGVKSQRPDRLDDRD